MCLKCTGNQGFYHAKTRVGPDGTIQQGYSQRPDFGDSCHQWGLAGSLTDRTNDEPWCFVPCDTSICPHIPRHRSHLLWGADAAGVTLCFSYETCGGTDFLAPARANCSKRGGSLFEGMCSCDVRPGSCVQAVSIAPFHSRPKQKMVILLCINPLFVM